MNGLLDSSAKPIGRTRAGDSRSRERHRDRIRSDRPAQRRADDPDHGPRHAAHRLARRILPRLGEPRLPRHSLDNRDAGLSTKMRAIGWLTTTALLAGATLRMPVRPPYGLADMASDAVGLMDALHIDRAHIIGASMGRMIAQIVAAEYPERVKSLVSLMSTSGDPALPGPAARVLQALLRPRPRRDPERGIAQTTDFLRLVGR